MMCAALAKHLDDSTVRQSDGRQREGCRGVIVTGAYTLLVGS